MSNFYPAKEDLIYLYEVTDPQGIAIWGGERLEDMFDWYRRSGQGSRVFISTWDSNDEDAYMIGRPIEITSIVASKVGEGE
jgi:hypothetical protein